MKKIIILFLMSLVLMSCLTRHQKREIQQIYGNKHELKKFNVKTNTETHTSGFFFFVVGGFDSKTTEVTRVRMYFKNNNGSYQFLEKSLHDIYVHTDSTIDNPYITFNCTDNDLLNANSMVQPIEYLQITVHCKESDFNPEININDLK